MHDWELMKDVLALFLHFTTYKGVNSIKIKDVKIQEKKNQFVFGGLKIITSFRFSLRYVQNFLRVILSTIFSDEWQ